MQILSPDILNINNKTRSNLLPWRGQFSPQLIEALLKNYAKKEYQVLDPFVGSGTVLFECGRLNLRAIGSEVNPAAAILSRTYKFINVNGNDRFKITQNIEKSITKALLRDNFSLVATKADENIKDVKNTILTILDKTNDELTKNLIETFVILLDYYKDVISNADAMNVWSRLKKTILALPLSNKEIAVLFCDARNIPLPKNSIDLIITSPPYINVFNYHQQYRRSAEALGWKPLMVAESEIGSNRKFRANRFLTVVQYCIDMTEVLIELYRLCKEKSHLIFVVGRESNVKKTAFKNSEIFIELAKRCSDFNADFSQERYFKNKFGDIIYEDIIHLFPNGNKGKIQKDSPQVVAREFLKDAMNRVPEESKDALFEAISSAEAVKASPTLDIRRALDNRRRIK